MTKPILIRMKDGREGVVKALTKRLDDIYPGYKVVSYEDGTPYVAPKPPEPPKAEPKDSTK